MEKYFKLIEDNYIVLVGTGSGEVEISREEYELILTVIKNRPVAEAGFDYRLKTDLTWELCEVPPIPEEDMEATEDDYRDALAELGVTLDEEI